LNDSDAQMQTVENKAVISGLHWYASDQYGLLITVGGVGGNFSQTDVPSPQSVWFNSDLLSFCLAGFPLN